MRMNVVSRKLIKPLIPTPPHLKTYNISFIDELVAPMNIAFLLFYPSKPQHYIQKLEESLAKILSQFHPLAGRYLKEDRLVHCSDEGAEFVRAEAVGVELMDLVGKIETGQLHDLLPPQYFRKDEAAVTPLLSVQTTEFIKCGGLVICISISHRVFDASSAGAFIAAWSHATNPVPGKAEVIPTWDLPSLLPCRCSNTNQDDTSFPLVPNNKIAIRSFLFDKEAIASLRSKLSPTSGRVSRGRLVTALIAKALIRLDQAKHAKPRDCIIAQTMDMRGRTTKPTLSRHSCGNFALVSLTRRIVVDETEEIGIQELVDVLGEAVRRSVAEYAEILSSDGKGQDIISANLEEQSRNWRSGEEVNFLLFSDLTKLEILYEADFGWGKPVWSCVGPLSQEKVTMAMSNKEGDGILARVHLELNDMLRFQEDQDIRFLATYQFCRL